VDNWTSSQTSSAEPGFPAFRVPFDDEAAVEKLSRVVDRVFEYAEGREIIIVCVGTDRSTGDSFGPIVGSKLYAVTGATVYGTLDEPVHAINLAATLDYIRKAHRGNPFVLAIDACLGKFDHVGQIIVERGPLRPGAGVKKTLPEFGDFTITGVVNVSGFMEYFVLQNTRLGIVMKMSEIVVEALRNGLFRRNMRIGISQALRHSTRAQQS
jgi:putative sporulation protein YyaC